MTRLDVFNCQLNKITWNQLQIRSHDTITSHHVADIDGLLIKDLPADTMHQIMSFCSGNNTTINDVAVFFQSVGRLSKQLRRSCIVFCQRYPIDLDNNWQGRYKTIQFLCQNKVKLKSISLTKIWENLRHSLFIYLLLNCDLTALESVHIEIPYYHVEKSPFEYALEKAAQAAIPPEVYDLEHFFRTHDAVNLHSLQECLKLQVLGTLSQIVKKKENKVRSLYVYIDDWDNSIINQEALELLKSVCSLESLTLIAYGKIESSMFSESIRTSFFAALEEIISSLHISNLFLWSHDFNGELRLKSETIQELKLCMPVSTIAEIKCPCLTDMRIGIGSLKTSFLSGFSSPMLETCTLVLDKNITVEVCNLQSKIASEFIKMNKSLKHLTIEDGNNNLLPFNYNLNIESESLERINAVSSKRYLNIMSINCPSLQEFKIPFTYNEQKWHCPIRSEPVFRQIYDQMRLHRRDFLGKEFDLKTINIPDNCLLTFVFHKA